MLFGNFKLYIEHGVCSEGLCLCDRGWFGSECENMMDTAASCPTDEVRGDCTGNGVCQLGKCHCTEEYEADDCSGKTFIFQWLCDFYVLVIHRFFQMKIFLLTNPFC